MSETFVLDTVARFVGGTEDAELRISNAGTGTIYYDNERTVSSSSNDGSVAAGASATRRVPTWLVATTQTPVTITRTEHAEDSHNVHGFEGDFADVTVTQEAPINVDHSAYEGDIQAAIDFGGEGAEIYVPPTPRSVSSSLTISEDDVHLFGNATITAGQHPSLTITGDDVRVDGLGFTRSTSDSDTTAAAMSNVVVGGARAKLNDLRLTNAKLACLYFVSGAGDGARVAGGRFTNTSAQQDSALVYAAASGTSTVNKDILIDGVDLDGTCAVGAAFYDSARCEVVNCKVRNMAVLPTVTLAGWTSLGSNIYRITDRTDGVTRILFNNGVQVAEETVTPTTPGSNEWGGAGGFVYLNLGGTDPASRTITSKVTSGYGLMWYITGGADPPAYANIAAHNEIHDTDGSGIYLAFGSASIAANNKTIGNVLENVATAGIQHASLPAAGIAVDGGHDTLLLGDTITGSGSYGVHVQNGSTGRAMGVVSKGAAASGWRGQSSGWRFVGCNGDDSTDNGWTFHTASGESFDDISLIDCQGNDNGARGLNADNSLGTLLSLKVIGGRYDDNTTNGIALGSTTNSRLVEPQARGNGSTDIVNEVYSLASAAALTLPDNADFINVTGTADITSVVASYTGRRVTLKFAGSAATNGIVDGSNLKLASTLGYTPDDTISLTCDGTNWYETGRSVN